MVSHVLLCNLQLINVTLNSSYPGKQCYIFNFDTTLFMVNSIELQQLIYLVLRKLDTFHDHQSSDATNFF